MAETTTKPYLIRALYEWCCDNGYTPYLAVAVDRQTRVPRQHVKAGEIVLNVSPTATSRLEMGNERIEFQARFSGVAQQISVPVANVSAIYARETGHGMAFEVQKVVALAEVSDDPDPGSAPEPGESDDTPAVQGETPVSTDSITAGARGTRRRPGLRATDADATAEAAAVLPRRSHVRAVSVIGQGADVIAFGPKTAISRRRRDSQADRSSDQVKPDQRRDDEVDPSGDDEPPPAGGGAAGESAGPAKPGKVRLTRVK